MLSKDAKRLSKRHRERLEKFQVRLVEVPWSLPPTLKWWPSNWWPGKFDGWCGPQDLVRLHTLGLEDYDAENITFDKKKRGWGDGGFGVAENYFTGAECGQGFFHTFFYNHKH